MNPDGHSPLPHETRFKALDGLRGVAVAMVFAFHAYPGYFPGAFIGVDIFFVLSGFVITLSLLADPNLKRFYLHRAFRILPPVIPVLIFAALTGSTWLEVTGAATSAMNWLRAFEVTDGDRL